MSAPVDVLAELRRAAADEREWGDRDDAERLSEAVAAVAELIAADKEYDAAHEAGSYLQMKAATERRAVALARVTGGQS